MKPKCEEFDQEFLITADNCIPFLLALDFMMDPKWIPIIANNYCTVPKNQIALPISAQTTTGS